MGVGKIIYLGAEAVLIRAEFLGRDAVYKIRIPKPYRDPRLDKTIRVQRTKTEARMMLQALRVGASVPAIFFVDIDKATLIMEYISGFLLKHKLNNMDIDSSCNIMKKIGVSVGRMHEANIVHGDLTTSNMILKPSGNVYIVDFGLAKISDDIEDKGVDIHLFLRSLESVHHRIKDMLFECFMLGYEEVIGKGFKEKIMEKVREIRLRGRYVEERRLRKEYIL